MKGLLSIKEFAEFVGMKLTTLKFYDREGLFTPARRDEANNYRRYSPTQITTLNMVQAFSDFGISGDTIARLAEERSPDELVKLLRNKKNDLSGEIRWLQDIHTVIDTYIRLMDEGLCADEDEVTVKYMEELPLILGGVNDFSDGSGGEKGSDDEEYAFLGAFRRFCDSRTEPRLNLLYPIGGYFEDMDAFIAAPSQPTKFFSIDPKGRELKRSGHYLVGCTRGYYGVTNDLTERMAKFAEKHGLKFDGPMYNIYLFDELSVVDRNEYLMQASVPIRDPGRTFTRPNRRGGRRQTASSDK